jgi:hypothetical protein
MGRKPAKWRRFSKLARPSQTCRLACSLGCLLFQQLTVRVPVVSSLPHRRSENGLHMLCEVEFTARLDL